MLSSYLLSNNANICIILWLPKIWLWLLPIGYECDYWKVNIQLRQICINFSCWNNSSLELPTTFLFVVSILLASHCISFLFLLLINCYFNSWELKLNQNVLILQKKKKVEWNIIWDIKTNDNIYIYHQI